MADFGPMVFGPQTRSLSWTWLLSKDPGSYWLLQQPGVPLRDTLYLGYFKAKQTATHFLFLMCMTWQLTVSSYYWLHTLLMKNKAKS